MNMTLVNQHFPKRRRKNRCLKTKALPTWFSPKWKISMRINETQKGRNVFLKTCSCPKSKWTNRNMLLQMPNGSNPTTSSTAVLEVMESQRCLSSSAWLFLHNDPGQDQKLYFTKPSIGQPFLMNSTNWLLSTNTCVYTGSSLATYGKKPVLFTLSLSHDPEISETSFQPLNTGLCRDHEAKRMNQWLTEVSQAKKDHLLYLWGSL